MKKKQEIFDVKYNGELTFGQLRRQNVARCPESFHSLDNWTPLEWAGAMCGEAGEAANFCKKIKRLEKGHKKMPNQPSFEKLQKALAKELADMITYADLLAARCGIDLGEAVRAKFNEVSDRVKSKRML